MLPLVSVINSRFLSVNPALISLILIHPVLRVAILPLILATHHSHHPPPLHSFIPGLKSSLLQILPIVASRFFSRTESTDSPNYYRYFWAYPFLFFSSSFFFYASSAFTLRKGTRPEKPECWGAVWSEVQTCIWPSWCHCHSLSLASVKPRLVLPFWCRFTWVVSEKGPLNCVL